MESRCVRSAFSTATGTAAWLKLRALLENPPSSRSAWGCATSRGWGGKTGTGWRKRPGRAPFRNLPDLARRSRLHQDKLEALAEAGAFECLGLDRRGALWQIQGLTTEPRPLLPLAGRDPLPRFPALSGLETILWDHRASGHSSRAHLLKPLRPALKAQGLPTARANSTECRTAAWSAMPAWSSAASGRGPRAESPS